MEIQSIQVAPFSQDAQKVRPARPQAEQEPEAYPQGYVEDSCEPRTPLVDFFSILLCAPVELRDHLHHIGLLRFRQFGIDRNGHDLFSRLLRQRERPLLMA